MSKIFSERLPEARKAKGVTQNDLAKLLCKKRSTISGYESVENKEPDFDSLCIIAQQLGVSADYLIGLSDNPSAHYDDVLFNDNKNITKNFRRLSAELKELFVKLFDDFYVLLSHDLQQGDTERLEMYAALFHSLRERRSEIKNIVERYTAGSGSAYQISELLTKQNELKNEVSILLDKFLQSDLEAAIKRPSK